MVNIETQRDVLD